MTARLRITEVTGNMTGMAWLVYTNLTGQRLEVSGIQCFYVCDKRNKLKVLTPNKAGTATCHSLKPV